MVQVAQARHLSTILFVPPMQHCHIHEAVNRTFQDICNSDLLFGGLPIVFSGDFQQILPVIEKGSRAEIIGACI
jgi:hypothetical protein